MPKLVTNLRVYLAIAEEAAATSKRRFEEGRRPRPDGPGYIMTFDPEQKSFKQALVAIAFAGMYLEALIGLVAMERFGDEVYEKLDRSHFTYGEKLRLLGIRDQKIFDDCERLRLARNDLVHEKPLVLDEQQVTKPRRGAGRQRATELRVAQREAAHALETVKAIAAALNDGEQG